MTTYYSTAEAAARLGLSKKLVQEYARRGTMSAVKVDGRYQISGPAIAAFVRNRLASRTHCRRGHDLREPGGFVIDPRTKVRRCWACRTLAKRRHWRLRHNQPDGLTLAERHPKVFRDLADATRDCSPRQRLAVGLRFWGVAP